MGRFSDIDWLMSKIDVDEVLDRLGVRIHERVGDEIWAWCPDHHLFTNKEPSHPKWSVNVVTGKTKCMTEDRGSNLVYTVSRLRKCRAEDAAEWMIGSSGMTDANLEGTFRECQRMKAEKTDKPDRTVKWMNDINGILKNGSMTARGYGFFMNPPGKKPTLIEKATVDHFGCVEVRNGFFTDRVVVPFKVRGNLVGFAAIDILGKKEWARRHPTMDAEKEYRKVLYPSGFVSRECLYGFDECSVGEPIVCLVEGPREVMKLWQVGVKALAVLHAGITDEQVNLLAHISPKKIVIMMDGDDAGYEAQRKMYDRLCPDPFSNVIKGNTPRGYDPKILPTEEIERIVLKEREVA